MTTTTIESPLLGKLRGLLMFCELEEFLLKMFTVARLVNVVMGTVELF
jgi:hypothetical protein